MKNRLGMAQFKKLNKITRKCKSIRPMTFLMQEGNENPI